MAPATHLRHSLRLRLIFSVGFMLVPLLATGIVYYYSYLQLTLAFGEVVEEALEESIPLHRLQLEIQKWRALLHQAHHEKKSRQKDQFLALTRHIEATMDDFSGLPFTLDEEKKLYAKASTYWKEARHLGLDHLAGPMEYGEGMDASLAAFDQKTDDALGHLETINKIAHAEIVEMLKTVETAKTMFSLSNLFIFLLAVGLVILIGLLLSRSILAPLEALESGVQLIARGDLEHRLKPKREDELGKLMEVFNQMANDLAESQATLKDMTVRDPLTGLFNHREFFRLLQEEVRRARRLNHPLAVLMCDLDFFKQINDSYGHQTGDQVLSDISTILTKNLRQIDYIARYGGEEFAAILPEADDREAAVIAERLREAIQNSPLKTARDDEIQMTISIGLAIFPQDGGVAEALVASADQALYRAKGEGRNQVCRASPGQS